MFARECVFVLLALIYSVASGPAFEGNPFLQVLGTSKLPSPQTTSQKTNQTDLYVVLPFTGQQLQQSPSTVPPPPTSNLNHVHSFDCSNRTSHVHPQKPLQVQQQPNSNTFQTTLNANTPELNRRCLKSTGMFLGTSCNKFVTCLRGIATELSCPDGLVFNAEGLYCDRPENVKCNGQSSTAAPQDTNFPSRQPSTGSPIHASLGQFSAVPPQQVSHLQQQQLSQSSGNANLFIQPITTPATSAQVSPIAGISTVHISQGQSPGVQQNNQQQHEHNQHQYQQGQQQYQQQSQQQQNHQHNKQQNQQGQQHYHQQSQQQHNQQGQQHYHQQSNQQQSHQQHQEQHHQEQQHQQQSHHHQQQYYQQQHHQQQSHQEHHHEQQHYQQQNHQEQHHQQHQYQQEQHHQQQHFQQNQNKQQNHQEQQQVSQSATSGNPFVQSPAQQNVLAGFPVSAASPVETNEISGSGGDNRCVTLRGQFASNACHTFLNCWGGVATEQTCPDGLLFSTKGYCDYPENVNCAGRLLVAPQPVVAAPIEIKSPPSSSPAPTLSFTPTTSPTLVAIPSTLPTPTAAPLPTVVAPQLKSKCLTARGQFPSISCNKFVNCWDSIILEQDCPEGFLFSTKGYCDFSHNVQCGDRPVASRGTDTSSKLECPLENGTFRDRNKCSSYITCAANKIVARYECPEGLNYNDYLGVCDFSYRVDCSKDPLLIPGRSNTNIAAQLRRGDECPADFATYRDAYNCGIYYTCVSKTIVATYECPVGFSFNDEIGICDYSEKVDCTKAPKIFQVPKNVLPQVTDDIKQKIETCTPGTMFSLNPQCTAVCLCRNGMAEIVQCPAGLAYDSKMDKCILPHLAKC